MRRNKSAHLCARSGVLLLALLLVAGPVLAQVGAPYDLTWNTIDGGGETFSAGGPYVLGGTIGQPDAGLLGGGDYTLGGGFWGGGVLSWPYGLHLPLVMRGF